MKRTSWPLAIALLLVLPLSACGGGGGSSSGGPVVPAAPSTPQPAPTPVQQSQACPSSGPASTSIAGGSSQSVARAPAPIDRGANQFVPGLVSVTYVSEQAARVVDAAASSAQARGASRLRFDSLGLHVRTLSVDPSRVSELISRMRGMPGVLSVERAQYRHLAAAVTVNDPYYRGFGTGAPFFESASKPGQWDMHAIDVSGAWGHFASLPARGAAIAVIDTGVDATHKELSGGKIIRQACFVTFPTNAAQTTGSFATDTDGHGTNVAGIADADTNNSFGYAGVAFDAPLLAYRIFPTDPKGGCVGSTSAQCSTTDADEVSAINDAVAHGARVINLSLGAKGPLSNCRDSLEQNAVESAIAHGVVVVAAAGNESQNGLDCPAAYPGVIAVGADGLVGAGDSTEAVARYSNWTGAIGGGGGGAYLVAPGGTASGGNDGDDLHWIENITSSESSDAAPFCTTDFAGEAGDCRAEYSGTSQATPHVTGVVSLMLGLRPGLTPAEAASALCSSAHDIGDVKQGCGRVDASAAVAKTLSH